MIVVGQKIDPVGCLSEVKALNSGNLRLKKTLQELFAHINVKRDNVLSMEEMLYFLAKLDVFLTEDECEAIMTRMHSHTSSALNNKVGRGRVEEHEFTSFFEATSDTLSRRGEYNQMHLVICIYNSILYILYFTVYKILYILFIL